MARTDLEQLQFQMAADIRGLQKQLQRALKDTKDTADKMDRHMGHVFEKADPGKAIEQIFSRSRLGLIEEGGAKIGIFGSALEHLGVQGLAAAGALAAMGLGLEEAHKALEFADHLTDAAKAAHVTTDALQEYQYALRLAGGDESKAAEGLQEFSAKLGAAQEGMPRAVKAFQALGFTPAQIKSWHDAGDALPIVAEAISHLKSDSLKDAAISQTGLEGLKLLIERGPDAIRDFRAEAHTAGQVMDAELVRRGKELNEQVETAQRKISVELKSAFVDLGPVLLGLVKLMAEVARWAHKVADAFSDIEHKSDDGLRQQLADIANQNARFGLNPEPAQRTIIANNTKRRAEIEAELARRAALEAPPAPGGTGELNYPHAPKGPTAAEKLARGREALDEAQKAQAAAQRSLTDNLEEIARLTEEEIEAERKKKVDQLNAEISQGKIDKALALKAIDAEDEAARLKKEKARRDAEEKLDDEFFATQQKVAQIYDGIASINASLATTVAARLAIEKRALLQRQKEERDAQQREFDRQREHGNFDPSRAAMLSASLADQQAAQLRELEDRSTKELAGEFAGLIGGAFDALRNKKDVMVYLADAFGSRLLDNFVDNISRILAKASINAPDGSFLNVIGSIFGHRAAGGPVQAGRAYMVGESGPEPFIPSGPGTIIPNHIWRSLGSGGAPRNVTVTMNINAPGAMMADEFIAYVDKAKNYAIKVATVQGAAAAAQIVPARMARAARQRFR